ncbi:MAG: ABC transporter substrate-binding protein [Acidobacteriota bacterium]
MKTKLLPLLAATALAALSLSLLLAGCGPRSAPEQDPPQDNEPKRGGSIIIATSADISGFNPLIVSSNRPTELVLRHVFPQLAREQADFEDGPPSFTPSLAESWEWSEDHKTATFKLRKTARWSDGAPITAEDVRFSWQAQIDPDVAWDTVEYKESITDVEVVDPHTVRFHFDRVYPNQMLHLNESYVLPKHRWSEIPFSEWRQRSEWFRDNAVFGGPFLIASWSPQQEIVLERNPEYWDPVQPYLDRVVFRIVTDQSNQISQLLAGQIDMASNPAPDQLDRLKESEGVRLLQYWGPSFIFIGWNQKHPMFQAQEVRQALTLAIDRVTLVEALWGDAGRVSDSPILQNVWIHNDQLEPYPYNPSRAKEILANHGWQDTDGDGILDRDGEPFAFELITNVGNRQRLDATVMIQSQLKRIGIDVTPQVIDFQNFIARKDERDFDAVVMGWTFPTTMDFRYAFHSRKIPDMGNNFVSFSDERVDEILDEIAVQVELADAEPLLLEMQEILNQRLPYTFLWESKRSVGLSVRVRDAKPSALFQHDNLPEWWVIDAVATTR